MAEPTPMYTAPTELHRYFNVYGYKYFAPTELRLAEHRTLNAKRFTMHTAE